MAWSSSAGAVDVALLGASEQDEPGRGVLESWTSSTSTWR